MSSRAVPSKTNQDETNRKNKEALAAANALKHLQMAKDWANRLKEQEARDEELKKEGAEKEKKAAEKEAADK